MSVKRCQFYEFGQFVQAGRSYQAHLIQPALIYEEINVTSSDSEKIATMSMGASNVMAAITATGHVKPEAQTQCSVAYMALSSLVQHAELPSIQKNAMVCAKRNHVERDDPVAASGLVGLMCERVK